MADKDYMRMYNSTKVWLPKYGWLPVSFDARRILFVFAGITMRISASFATSIANRVMSRHVRCFVISYLFYCR